MSNDKLLEFINLDSEIITSNKKGKRWVHFAELNGILSLIIYIFVTSIVDISNEKVSFRFALGIGGITGLSIIFIISCFISLLLARKYKLFKTKKYVLFGITYYGITLIGYLALASVLIHNQKVYAEKYETMTWVYFVAMLVFAISLFNPINSSNLSLFIYNQIIKRRYDLMKGRPSVIRKVEKPTKINRLVDSKKRDDEDVECILYFDV